MQLQAHHGACARALSVLGFLYVPLRTARRACLLAPLLLLFFAAGVRGQPNGIFHEVWLNLSGSSLPSFTNSAIFNPPDSYDIIVDLFEGPYNYAERFGDRFRALIVPPLTGTYVFWIAGDDTSALFLSIDESPANKGQIGGNTLTALYGAWYTYPSQQSTNVYLEAGRRYYIEALHSAGSGDDSLNVGWKLPDGTLELPIPALRLRPFGMTATTPPVFTAHPTNTTVLENAPAIFRLGVSNLDTVSYQWQRGTNNIPGAIGATYVLSPARTNDNGAAFRCVLSNSLGTATSASAILTVTTDTNRPSFLGVANLDSSSVQVMFSEPVEQASATSTTNYSINNGIAIISASIGTSPRYVTLTTSPMLPGSNYTLTVSNVRDRSAAQNTMVPNSQQTFTVLLKGVYREFYANIPGSSVSDLTNSPAFPSSPSSVELVTSQLETPSYPVNHYGQRLRARLIPPVTGNYTFWVAAADSATLFLGTNGNAASARTIASVTLASQVSSRQWDVQTNQKSAVISLGAGQQYYLEVLMKGGISDQFPADHLAVRWQLPDGSFEEPIPAARLTPFGLSLPVITAQPANTNAVEGSAATFAVSVSNLDPVTFQWRQNGTNLPGATNAIYTDSSVQLAENGSSFQCVLGNVIGSISTISAVLSVTPDVTPPTIAKVLTISSNRVVVFFSEPVEAASATNAINYTIGGASVTASGFRDNSSVTLSTSLLLSGGSYTLTVNGVRDAAVAHNTIVPNSQYPFVAGDFFPLDIGSPPLPGSITFAGNGVNIVGSGSGSVGAIDQFNFSYRPQKGNFDVKVRVQRLDFADMLTQAGLMIREDLTTNSRYAAVFSTPSIAGSFFQYRANTNLSAQTAGTFPANYPDTWLRLQRAESGSRFNGYASYDGLNWTLLGTAFIDMHATIFLGFAVSSHNPSQATVAQFRDFADSSSDVIASTPVTSEPPGPSSRRTGLVFTEIMYHPAPRTDGRKLEFVELYNSNPTLEDISGYRLSGDVDYTFPQGTTMAGGAILVLARSPADIQAVYGIPNVTGPYTNSLSNKSGTVRLRNRQNAILLEVNYESKAPWPLAPDGSGHSLVLARPSFGEDHPEAWGQSDAFGGSPGLVDGIHIEPVRSVVINEFLAHTDLPDLDYIELYNHSTVPVDLSGCWLSDSPTTNKFRIPNGTVIGSTGFVYFTEATLGFSLSASGESIFFVNSNLTRVVDSISFGGQENGVSTGRVPDGGPRFYRLAAKTPGARNGAIRSKNLVINEIMYKPVTGDDNDEFIEIYNRGTNAINLTNWRFNDGIDFDFPTNLVIATNAYLVIAKNAAHLRTNYPNLNVNNTVGDYSGTLANSGERIALAMSDTQVTTNNLGVVSTNLIHIVVDEVTYGTGGRWGNWSDAGGSSLELIDPRSDNRLPSNWADSDDTAKSAFTTLTVSGTLDNASGSAGDWNELQVYLLEEGECLVDNVDVRVTGLNLGGNLVTNGTFEVAGLNNWIFQGDHRFSYIDTPGDGGGAGSHALHLVASDRGDVGANRTYTVLNAQYDTNGVTGSITARVKWLHGRPEILFRLRGNHLELAGVMAIPKNLGTPGARNSRYATNAAPAITEILHSPVVPAADQPVVVTARVHDPDGLASVQLVYRIDGSFSGSITNFMLDDGTGGDAVAGDGIYSATIPGQPNDTMVAFYIRATDGFSPAAISRFPNNAPARECLVHFGDAQPISTFGTYRFWITQATLNDWLTHEKFSSESYQGTFIYNNFRPIYNSASHYAGSPAHAKLYDGPMGTNCDYQLLLPDDDALLDETSLRIQEPGLFGADATCQNEQLGYWLINQLNLPALNRRSINMFVNGLRRGLIYEDTQRQNSGFDDEWYPNPDSDNNDLYRIGYWYEFSDDLTHRSDAVPSLQPFTTTGGVKKLARYRQTFNKRAIKDSAHNYTNLFNLVDVINTTATGDAYAAQVYPVVDIVSWARAFAAERIINNTDLYGAKRLFGPDPKPGAQNSFIFKPAGGTWKFLIWDIDAAFLGLPTDSLFDFTDPPVSNLFTQPLVLRTYWQALEDAAYGPLAPAKLYPPMDSKYAAYLGSGIAAASPQKMKDFLGIRRDYILELLTQSRANFAIANNGGNNFTNGSTLATLSGTAQFAARRITINGLDYPLSWSSVTNWSIQLALTGPTNSYVVQGYDAQGNALSNASANITIYYPGPISRPEDSLVINEIMYNPAVSNASYVEIYNRSTNTYISLSNYRLHGVDFDFTPGTLLGPQSFLVLAEDVAAFQAAYGSNVPIAGVFNGNLDPENETLTLVKQATTTNETDVVIDKVRYDSTVPWPARPGITNSGVPLQLIDAAQDNARVSNWDDGAGWRFYSFTAKPASTSSPRFFLWLDGSNEVYLDDIRLVLGTNAGVGSNYLRNADFETNLVSPWVLTGTPGPSTNSNAFAHSGTNSLRLSFTKAGSATTCLYQDLGVSISSSSNYTVSFWYRPTISATNGTNLTVRLASSSGSSTAFSPVIGLKATTATPGASNWVVGTVTPYPLLWLNEVQPNNLTGLPDNTGTPQPWIELFNSSTNTISLNGLYLSRSYTNLTQWAFPTGSVVLPGQFRIIFADGQPQLSTGAVLHTSFRLDPTNGAVVLSRGPQILDYLNYTNMEPGLSYGAYPDGQVFDRQVFYFVTPGASNNPAPIPVAINEWMASNTHTLQNPANLNKYDDWFELYNFGSATINLSGYYLTDDLGNKNKWPIPNGVVIAPHTFLLCWADNNLTGTNMMGNALHTSFQLSKSGDQIGLFSPEGVKVDSVSFGGQTTDVTQGRYPDGNVGGVYYFMPTTTPRTNNVVTNNLYAPVLTAIYNYTISEGEFLTFNAHATDADAPAQTLTYSLLAGAPEGATMDPVTGVFTWTPLESQGGAVYPITVSVTDNAGPPLSTNTTFTVTVTELNNPPFISAVADQTIDPTATLSVAIPLGDIDLPLQTLTCALISGPPGASMADEVFSWTPGQVNASTTNLIVVTVTDDGVPPLSATQSFRVFVTPGNPCNGFKGDVLPLPDGNGFVTSQDWVQIGRYAAHVIEPSSDCESAKADCAPKPCGNGFISIADWVQAGRYAAGFDSPLISMSACSGAFSPLLVQARSAIPKAAPSESGLRSLSVSNLTLARGETKCLQLFLNAQGDEIDFGISLKFDPALLTFVSADFDGYSTNAVNQIINSNAVSEGRIGFLLALNDGDVFPAGLQPVAKVCLTAVEGAGATSTQVMMTNTPVFWEIDDVDLNPLDTAFLGGSVTITAGGGGGPVRFESITMLGEGHVKLTLVGPAGVSELQRSSVLGQWERIANITNLTGRVDFIDTFTNAAPRFYRAVQR